MICPQCQNAELDVSGACPLCGEQIADASAMQAEASESPGVTTHSDDGGAAASSEAVTDAEAQKAGEELPEWRQELAERLQAIRQRKEALGARPLSQRRRSFGEGKDAGHSRPANTPLSDKPNTESRPDPTASLRAEMIEKMKTQKPAPRLPVPVPLQKRLEPLMSSAPAAKPPESDHAEVRRLIDAAMSGKNPAADEASHVVEASHVDEAFDAEEDVFIPEAVDDSEGKLILLSRTLSGLVDLICVVVCTGGVIVAADYFSGILSLDGASAVCFAALFLLIFLLYSFFFLSLSNQTIGMMLTDLRVESLDGRRPSPGQVARRTGAFLVSLFGLGIGLLWSLGSRENLCLHDQLSDTRVVRI